MVIICTVYFTIRHIPSTSLALKDHISVLSLRARRCHVSKGHLLLVEGTPPKIFGVFRTSCIYMNNIHVHNFNEYLFEHNVRKKKKKMKLWITLFCRRQSSNEQHITENKRNASCSRTQHTRTALHKG
jgi:hypothetical protein